MKGPKFYVSVMLLLIFIMALRTPIDSDMWWHLRAGEKTVTEAAPYMVDDLSHTRLGARWINHSWMAQVVMYWIYKLGGLRGISLWVGITVVLTFSIVYLQSEGGPLIKIFVLLLAAAVSSTVWTPRPQMFSLFLFALLNYLLAQYLRNQVKKPYFLIPLFVIWSNLHGGYALGFMLLGVYLIGAMIDFVIGNSRELTFYSKKTWELSLWGLVSWIAVLINPNGIGMWKIPFQTVGVETLQQLIGEWASPDFHQPLQQLFLVLMFLAFGVIGFSRKKLRGQEFMAVFVFGAAALIARRNFGPFALVTAPVICRHGQDILQNLSERAKERLNWFEKILNYQEKSKREINPKLQTTINWLVIAALVFASAAKLIKATEPEFVQDALARYYPVSAVEWIKENQPDGLMLNSYNWGGYLIWHLPEYPVFVDGRTDLYGDEILREWLDVVRGNQGWEKTLESKNIKLLILEVDQPLIAEIDSTDWINVYKDESAVIFTKH